MSEDKLTRESVERALDEIHDPETGRGVVAAGQLHDLKVTDDEVSLTLGLTTFAAPLWEETRAEAETHLRSRFPSLSKVSVRLAVHDRPAEKIGQIGLAAKSVIAVGSGKGGVGKSTIATILACGLSKAGAKVGLMDADVYGPSIPHLIGSDQQPRLAENRIDPVRVDGLTVMSMGYLIPPDQAVVWRGPMLHGAITQFLRDTDWGNLDYLIIDLPPGTGDVALTLSQLLPLSGAIVVCTPQDLALLDAVKAVAMFDKVKIDVLGIVENMSHFLCPDCGNRHDIFGSGGARNKAAELGLPFLGEVPINTQIRIRGDRGEAAESLDDEASKPYLEALCHNTVKSLANRRRRKPPMPTLSVL
ncbi:MAG: Mrp/NBP35 family ATP-binding protein [Planctomycetota bacterium]|jgi:ATP-binding protein involved in chromosome partitioning